MQTVTLEEIHRNLAIFDRSLERCEPVEIPDHGKLAGTLLPAGAGADARRGERGFPISKGLTPFGIAEVARIEREADPQWHGCPTAMSFRSRQQVRNSTPSVAMSFAMTTKEVLETVAAMPSDEWLKIQSGIAEMLAARFSEGEMAEIREALAEAEAEFARGEGIGGDAMRRHFGLQ